MSREAAITMDEKILKKMMTTAERFFGTLNDPEQMQITKDSFYKLQKLHPKTLIYRLENGEPVSWAIILPTQTELMDKFLRGEINEQKLLDMTKQQKTYEALYLCSAFTIPEFRRKGYIIEMMKEAINAIPHTDDVKLFAWPYSEEGKLLVEKLVRILGTKIQLKK